jgi:FkbM family methyltransferase
MLPDFISRDSTIYSVGVGEDVSFDLALIERFGVTVHAFDPTPRSIAWIGAQRLPDQFVFHNFGVADVDGRMMLYPPKRADHVSFSAVARASTASLGAEFQVFKLATIMRMLGHEHLDLLKMDIEGAEYGVIDSILETQVEVRQLLVEFHHRLPGIGARRTDVSVRRLRDAGFGLFHMSDSGEEYSFIRS